MLNGLVHGLEVKVQNDLLAQTSSCSLGKKEYSETHRPDDTHNEIIQNLENTSLGCKVRFEKHLNNFENYDSMRAHLCVRVLICDSIHLDY